VAHVTLRNGQTLPSIKALEVLHHPLHGDQVHVHDEATIDFARFFFFSSLLSLS